MVHEIKQVLVTVKTYPNPSKKYEETVCVAGIDLATNQWIRLYPIPFRDLEYAQAFKKYSVIEVKVEKSPSDNRPESYKVDQGSIRILRPPLDTKNHWEERRRIVIPTVSKSFCEILSLSASDKSLGMFKPANVSFSFDKSKTKCTDEREACYAQGSFFDKQKEAVEQIPYVFRYTFTCAGDAACPGHTLAIIDWEIGQSYRNWRDRYPTDLMDKIKHRWLGEMCSDKKDTYFFVGNWARFKDNFMVLGVFWPPKPAAY